MPKSPQANLTTLHEEEVALQRKLAQKRAEIKAAETRQRDARRLVLGRLVEEAGLADWEDGTLLQLFSLIETLRETSHPVAVLAGLLGDGVGASEPNNGTVERYENAVKTV